MTTETKDMTEAQFNEALRRHEMKRIGFMGYVEMFNGRLSISMLNANTKNRRARLVYLLQQKAKFESQSGAA